MLNKLFAFVAAAVGALAATVATQGCAIFVWDEPEAPKSMIEK